MPPPLYIFNHVSSALYYPLPLVSGGLARAKRPTVLGVEAGPTWNVVAFLLLWARRTPVLEMYLCTFIIRYGEH